MTDATHNQEPYAQVFTEEEGRRLLMLDLSSAHVRIDGVLLDRYIDQRVQALLSERDKNADTNHQALKELAHEVAEAIRRRRAEQAEPIPPDGTGWRTIYTSQINVGPLLDDGLAAMNGYTIDRQSDLPTFVVATSPDA